MEIAARIVLTLVILILSVVFMIRWIGPEPD